MGSKDVSFTPDTSFSIISRIDGILARIKSHPGYCSCVESEKRAALRDDAWKHDVGLNFRGDPLSFTGHRGMKELRKLHKRGLDHLRTAWSYLVEDGIDLCSLAQLGNMIAPEENTNADFRTKEVSFAGFSLPSPSNVIYAVSDLVSDLTARVAHPVVMASHVHLEMARVQPYDHANKRAARLLQNMVLHEAGYPPAVILDSDAGSYIGLRNGALADRYSGESSVFSPSGAEIEFNEFVASKVLDSARELEDDLRKRKVYGVDISGVKEPGILLAIANRVRSYGRAVDSDGVSVHVNRAGGTRRSQLQIIGDIQRTQLNSALERLSGRYHFGYAINPIGQAA